MPGLTAAQAKSMLLAVAQAVIDHKEDLCEADRNIGDGDHGIGMANGLEAAQKELNAAEFTDVYQVFSTVGRTMIKVMGGASGIIFGLLFYAGAKNMPPASEINGAQLTEIFEKALNEIQAKGQAKCGDKTLVDALEPMVASMKRSVAGNASIAALLSSAADAAEQGKEATRNYVAKFGKAKTLGERSLGYPDAGCVSLTLIMRTMSNWAAQAL